MHVLSAPLLARHGTAAADPTTFWALRDISFTVPRGEVLGVIGRNGAGKSTLLKILSRITDPTAGRVALRGRVASLLEVGTGFHPELTGRENIFLNGAILGMSRAETRRKFDEIVAFAEIDRFLDTPVKHYSSGMYVRLAFAVAAHLEPEILIVDEVLAVGDAEFQAKCLGKMESIAHDQARTVLFVSHNMTAIARLCHRVLLLDAGGIVLDGTVEQAINRYLDAHQRNSVNGNLGPQGVADGSPIALAALTFNSGEPVVHRRPLSVALQFNVRQPVPAVGFGIGFCGLDGRRVVTLETDYDGTFFRFDDRGDMVVEFRIPMLDLVPGRYRIDVGAFDGSHETFHYASDCATVEVLPNRDTPAHLHGVYGDYRPRPACRIRKL